MKLAWVSAVIAGVLGIFLLWLPMSLQAQLVLSFASLGVMFFAMSRPDNKVFRLVTFTFCAILAIRYGFWRSTETLPSISEPANFIPGFILYIAEMYCLVMLGISFFMLSDPLKRKTPPLKKIEDLPTVDVFVPTYNEDPELLAGTLAAAKSMVYPKEKIKIWLLDDGGTEQKRADKDPQKAIAATRRHEQLKALCEAMEVNYLTRKRNEHAKAGNMNEALKVTDGELVVVFDADHAPVRTFMRETVTYFLDDPKLFLAQTPHFFLNPDPLEKNLKTFKNMPSENEMFYSVVQTGLDKWDASFFCGSGAVLRRAALDTTGGFAGQSITEDCETALALHSNGWHSVYINKPLIAGLQPETFDAFIGQRARWCQGMLQILILNRPFLAKGLKMSQRLCYAGINLFWLFPISRLIFMFAPLLYIFFSLEIYQANIQEFCAYALTYLIASFGMQSYLHGKVRWPWISELYEYVQSVMLFGSILSVIRSPRKPTFNVTAKGVTLDNNFISPLARPYFVIFFLLSGAAIYSFWRLLTEPVASDLLLMVAGWNAINLSIAALALGVVAERRELRRNQRLPVQRHGLMRQGDKTWSILIKDASSGGIGVQFLDDVPEIEHDSNWQGEVEVRRAGKQVKFPVIIRSGSIVEGENHYGFAYTIRTPEVFMAIAEVMYSDQEILQERINRRQVRQNIVTGSWVFAKRSVMETIRAFAYLAGLGKIEPVESAEDAPITVKDNNAQIPGKVMPMPQTMGVIVQKLKYKLLIAGAYAALSVGTAISPIMAQSLFSNDAAPATGIVQSPFAKTENFIMTTRQPALALEDAVVNPTLIAFDQPRSRFKLEGEDALARFTFQHDMDKAGTIGELVIAYKNAVSVMPEASSLNIKVNGYPVGKFPIASSSEFSEHKFLIPANALVDGTNTVEIQAIQRHRVDCSLAATYELWTEIDFMNSGFLTEDEFTFSDLKSLKMIGRSENGLTDLRLVLPKNSGIGDLNAALPLVQTLSLALGRDDVAVTVSDKSGIGPGIDIYLAAMDRPDLNYPAAANAKHGLSVVQTQDARRVAVVLKAPSIGQATAQLLAGIRGELKPMLDAAISQEKHLEINADAGGVYTLGQAGYTARSFSGRLFRTNFDLVLPADFYPAEYATIDLGLHAATSPGLNPQSQLLVRVNGQIVTSLPMRDTDGEVFEDRRIELPMRAFRPGRNQIEVLAEVEKASDDACVYSERDETAPRFILLENTEIRVPQLARISRLPDLSVFAGTAYPYRNDERLNIYAVHADSRTLSAALTMMSKMSIASGAPLNAQVLLGRPDNSDRENKLVIAPRRAFIQSGPSVGDEPHEVSYRIKFYDADWLPDLITTASVQSIGLPKVTQATPEDLLQAFRHKTQKTATELSTAAVIKQKFDDLTHRFQSWLKYEPVIDSAVTGDIDGRKANLVQTLDDQNNSVVTWLAADTPEDVVRASLILAEPDIWSTVKGSDVTIDLRTKQLSAQLPSDYKVHAFTDKSPSNLRRLAAAWFSDNFIAYIVLIVAFFAFFAVWLGRTIPKAGVRTED